MEWADSFYRGDLRPRSKSGVKHSRGIYSDGRVGVKHSRGVHSDGRVGVTHSWDLDTELDARGGCLMGLL